MILAKNWHLSPLERDALREHLADTYGDVEEDA